MSTHLITLTLSCPNRPGIVAAVSTYLFEAGCNIGDAQQFDDTITDRFFMRVTFHPVGAAAGAAICALRDGFALIAARFDMVWTMRERAAHRRVLILASKFDHCLADLLYRWRMGEMEMDVAAIASNHGREVFAHHDFGAIPFHHLPMEGRTKAAQEADLRKLIADARVDLVILARYMQILSDDLSRDLEGRCINIHHSFLPSFKGARPYHQAHERGVKLIGATAHYVTPALDEGPIIEQDVEPISHRDQPEDLIRKGRDIERRVLARAVRHHLEDRVILNGSKTVVFTQ